MTKCVSAAAATAIVAVVLLSIPSTARAQGGAPAPAAEIQALERALADAMHARQRAQLEQLLAPDYVLRGKPDIDRTTWLQNALTLCWGDRSDIDDFRVQRYDDVAVTSFELTFYVDPGTCSPAVLRSLITDVWVRGADGWRLQVRHSGPPPEGGIAAQYGAVPEVPPVWDLRSELSLVATGGNTSTRTIGMGGSATHRAGPATTRGSIAFITSEVDAVTRARSLTVLGRHGLRVHDRLELFGEASYGRDRFAGIDNRATAAAGAAYSAPLPRPHALTTEGSLGYTVEQRLAGTDLRFATGIGAVHYLWTIVPGTDFTQDVGVIADLATTRNWRGTSATGLSVVLTRLLSFKASHGVEYRNDPVTGFGRTDMRTAAALVFSLQRR